ncbi:MAG: ABC transporter permease, partial [Desulfobacterales bacterium]|nr:ABC transporter permease [Desulfobacterales bacterium]
DVSEKILHAALLDSENAKILEKKEISGGGIRYVDWLFPGILAMNMMFSSLYGVGYVIVRYRKNGVLKRLKATPLTAVEYLTAQMLSRMFLLMFSVIVVWVGCTMIFSFQVKGSYLLMLLIFLVGGLSLVTLGMIIAARGASEEFTEGVLNFICWPMMFLSEVWFSLEGAPEWVRMFAKVFPLTHILTAVRKVMSDGAGLLDVKMELAVLTGMALLFLTISASLFSWNK